VANTFATIFRSILDDDDEIVIELRSFSDHDMTQVLKWNEEAPEKTNACVHEAIEKQASDRPEAQAVCAWDKDFTYLELNRLSNQLAHHLKSLGIGPEVMVPLCFEKSAWAIVAMLGVLKAGGACVSLDPLHPVSRLEGIIRDVDATIVLVTSKTAGIFVPLVQNVLTIDQIFLNALPPLGSSAPCTAVKPVDPAFVVYTSGSTGKPKGVVLEHASICTSVAAHGSALQIGEGSRVLQFAAYVFDISIQDIFTTLMRGGCVCVPSEEDRVNDLAGAMNKMDVNWACVTPTVASLLRPSDLPRLKTLTLAGEAVTKKVSDIWQGIDNLNNCYGPAESSIYCAWNGRVGKIGLPSNIGLGLSSLLWVVEIENHHRLTSVGAIGELLVEGPLLARGYLNNPEMTASSFIENCVWADDKRSAIRRMYKTGDLVRQNSNGTLDYLGRKDTQVKLHGQRLELGSVEYHLMADGDIQNAIAVFPTKGHCQNRLVVVTTLNDLGPLEVSSGSSSQDNDQSNLRLIDVTLKELAALQVSRIRKHLSSQLPSYMIPTVWLVVESIPLNTSGKLDRAKVARWVHEVDEETYLQIVSFQEEDSARGPTIAMDRQLQEVLGQVLNLPADRILLNRSFLGLGGDSITAMQAVSRARAEGIAIRVQDFLQSKSISELALVAKISTRSSLSRVDEVDTAFNLSPIQQMYFQIAGQQVNQFNQSFFLRLTHKVQPQDVSRAIEAVVRQHSMLRARFTTNQDGQWQQHITKDTDQSYRFTLHQIRDKEEAAAIMATSQASLDVQKGPVFSCDLFNMEDGDDQLLFLVAHHLVIDLVSWRIVLQDLEDILKSGALLAETPFPFQAWCKIQSEYAQRQLPPTKVLPFNVVPADYSYWGMENQPNLYGDTISQSFHVDADITSKLLGCCQVSLGTEPVEVFLATLLHAFNRTFVDRATPTVFSEGHGREPWDDEIDLAGSVGWFTTMSPLHVPLSAGASVVDTVRRTKDTRRKLPGNGWPYFASRFLNSAGMKAFADHLPMEMLFNYLGRYQQLEREDVLIRQESVPKGVLDVGLDVQRLALFELSVVVIQGATQFTVVYNSNMERQDEICEWMRAWHCSLVEAVTCLSNMEVERTLSDFPLLSMTYDGLQKLSNERMQQVGATSLAAVEDAYPCSPMQQGLLLSQTRKSGAYEIQFMFEVVPLDSSTPVDLELFLSAWQQVVDRHAALRTIFVDSVSENGVYDQIVLKHVTARTIVTASGYAESDALMALNEEHPIDYSETRPPHRVTVCETTSGKVFYKLEINHAIVDAASLAVIHRDLALAYQGTLPSGPKPLYSDYIKYIQDRPIEIALDFWKGHLANIEPCHFPILHDETSEVKELGYILFDLRVAPGQLRTFCDATGVTMSTILQMVWGLVLRCYTGSDQVCFGYITSGRDVAVDRIEEAIGPFINMLVCRMQIEGTLPVSQLAEDVQAGYLNGLEHQHCSLAQIQHALNLTGRPLFNTVMSVQRTPSSDTEQKPAVSFKSVGSHDPTEYDITVYGSVSDQEVSVYMSYWKSSLSDWQATNVASTFDKALQCILNGNTTLNELDLFSDHNMAQVLEWNEECLDVTQSCIHELFAKQALARPDAPAICAWDGNFTYLELDDLSTQVARHLVSLGVRSEVMVPMCFEKSAWAIVTTLAVLKAGGACVSLNPSHPRGRIESIVREVGARILVTSTSHEALLEGMAETMVVISPMLLAGLPIDRSFISIAKPKNAAFVIYTSGSTGQPKGVIQEHHAVCTSVLAQGSAMDYDTESRILQFAAYTFDVSIGDIFGALFYGGCICVLSDDQRMNDIAGSIRDMHADQACLTPTVARTLQPADVPSLKTLTLGGEALTSKDLAMWGGAVRLINIYGVTEATVWFTSSHLSLDENPRPRNIGRSFAGHLWIVDVSDHERLAPVGTIGELLLGGPTIARGYLNDADKTAAAFIKPPKWLQHRSGAYTRIYKTGDLARSNSDGTISYVGRKDTQVKLHGQRLELGEVEHYLMAEKQVNSAMAILPEQGWCKERLVAILSLHGFTPQSSDDGELRLVSGPQSKAAREDLSRMRDSLSDQLPLYMIPTLWVVVEAIPLNTSGKMDRAKLSHWVEGLDGKAIEEIMSGGEGDVAVAPVTVMEKHFHTVLRGVLGLPPNQIRLNRSFLALGGDSISAMQVISRCRALGITMKVQDIIQSKSISELALVAKIGGKSSSLLEDEVNIVFDLTPAQELYFQIAGYNAAQLNQRYFLRLTRETSASDMARAIEAVVRQHSMLRARFQQGDNSQFGQLITKNVNESYRFQVHETNNLTAVTSIVIASQASLDGESGPLFSADLINVEAGGQLLFLVANYLVVDMLSWHVILHDLEEVLNTGELSAETPFPFQAWSKLQVEAAQQHLVSSKVLPVNVLSADYAYWDMDDRSNVHADAISEHFTIDATMTSLLLGSCQEALGTRPVELFIATLLHAFVHTFVDRSAPTIFNESHDREFNNAEVDISGTVGWFTTILPLYVPVMDGTDMVSTLRQTKDTRRKLIANGLVDLATRFRNVEAGKVTDDYLQMEFLFRYLGYRQHLDRDAKLFRQEPLPESMSVSGVGLDAQRLALFDVSVEVVNGTTCCSVVYNRHIQYQSKVRCLMQTWKETLKQATELLPAMQTERTLSDFPLLSLTYPSLDKLKNETLALVGVTSFNEVEDVYPCTPMQQGIRLGQNRVSGAYELRFIFQVEPAQAGEKVNMKRLTSAWQAVVHRHAALRTVFVESVSQDGLFDQVVLKNITGRTLHVTCDDSDVLRVMSEQPTLDHKEFRPPHCVTLCETSSGNIFCMLEISHAIVDASSTTIMLQELALSYDEKLPSSRGPLYAEYVRYLQAKPLQLSKNYWKEYLHGLDPCYFPTLTEGIEEKKDLLSIEVDMDLTPGLLRSFCDAKGVTMANVIQTVWGLVLRCYTGSDQVCFGYLASGRDAAVEGIEGAIGPFINMLVCRLDVTGTTHLGQLVEQVQANYLAALEHQHCSLAEIQHVLKLAGRPLFNTLMSIKRWPLPIQREDILVEQPSISFKSVGGYDPTEVSVTKSNNEVVMLTKMKVRCQRQCCDI
jgi:amino acid adenylation domain-containing protein/non-ribosomal peptide synthase protein (TIGR01720 family)